MYSIDEYHPAHLESAVIYLVLHRVFHEVHSFIYYCTVLSTTVHALDICTYIHDYLLKDYIPAEDPRMMMIDILEVQVVDRVELLRVETVACVVVRRRRVWESLRVCVCWF